MSEKVAAPKAKKIAKSKAPRQCRLWVRAKFLSFRRYALCQSDQKLLSIPIKSFSDSKESMIVKLLNSTSVREQSTSTSYTQEKPITDLEYIRNNIDHLGQNHHQSRKHRCRTSSFQAQPSSQSHRFNPQSYALPSTWLIFTYLNPKIININLLLP